MSNTKPIVTIKPLERLVYAGDWHDKPLKWEVSGPGNERQLFSNLREAKKFRSCRRKSASEPEAQAAYVATWNR